MRIEQTFLMYFCVCLLTGILISCDREAENGTPEVSDDVDIRPEVIFTVADNLHLHMYIESKGVAEPIRVVIIRPRISILFSAISLEVGDTVISCGMILYKRYLICYKMMWILDKK